ncbi:MAG: hypothetical protein Q4D61_05065 [Cardiobacteriaceae bacterium]|nr:hypothetical protein [Cardiobacteriaceae bacterium]
MRILIATCRPWPDGNDDLRQLARRLDAELRPWQDIVPDAAENALILPLAAWDYSASPEEYRAWLQNLAAHGVRIQNPPALQQWNMDKRYLLQPGLTPGIALLPGEDWTAALAACPWDNPVIKPLIGQSGRGVRRLAEGQPAPADYREGILVQPFIHAPFGEACLIYLNGQYSHAAHRKPPAGEWRANSAYGVEILPLVAETAWRQQAENALAALAEAPLYARVDGLIDEQGAFHLNEIELIEPALYTRVDDAALPRLAAAILNCADAQ